MPGGAPRTRQRGRYGRLRPGDRVAVVAPSGPAAPSRLEAGCAVLRDLGLDAVVGKHALDRVNLGRPGPVRDGWHRLAGSDADRAADLQSAWCGPSVRAVICSRGGYGATRPTVPPSASRDPSATACTGSPGATPTGPPPSSPPGAIPASAR